MKKHTFTIDEIESIVFALTGEDVKQKDIQQWINEHKPVEEITVQATMKDELIKIIAEYLSDKTQLKTTSYGRFREFTIDWQIPISVIAAELADAIAPHLEAGAGWENAPSWAEWRTVDGNGAITYWKDKPEPSKRNDYWTLAKGDRYEQIPHTVKDWKETLQKRPR